METKPITVHGVRDAIKKQFVIENSEHGINRFETDKVINRLTQILDQTFHDAALPSDEEIKKVLQNKISQGITGVLYKDSAMKDIIDKLIIPELNTANYVINYIKSKSK